MRNKKLERLLKAQFGRVPDGTDQPSDMQPIRGYDDYRERTSRDPFRIDDITWNDLSMDKLFQRMNSAQSTPGEQYLYHWLRTPAVTQDEYEKRYRLIRLMEGDAALRLAVEKILWRLGRARLSQPARIFDAEKYESKRLFLYLTLSIGFAAAAVGLLCLQVGILPLLFFMTVNGILHEYRLRRIRPDVEAVNYAVAMIFALRRVQRLSSGPLDHLLAPAYQSLRHARAVLRTGGVSTDVQQNPFLELANTFLLLDLIAYERVKRRLWRCHEAFFDIHEALGSCDAAIAVASYRKSIEAFAEPTLDFDPRASRRLIAKGLRHPLLTAPVPNDLTANAPLLITGSNASGKSTLLRTAALCAIMGQGVCTCLAERYTASAFRVYTSMALTDDLLAGESYYITELRALKRIMDAAGRGEAVLCVVDEVLRGTNTAERIAASRAVLLSLKRSGALCLAATHDQELCELLKNEYTLCHFEEQLTDGKMTFDYRLREGPATTRNAIELLRILGFDSALVEQARQSAEAYLTQGRWDV